MNAPRDMVHPYAGDLERITAGDREWFKAHPDRSFRLRFSSAGEVWEAQQFNGPLPPGTECLVTAVRRLPGMRVRFHTPMRGLRVKPEDASEQASREFFLSLFPAGSA